MLNGPDCPLCAAEIERIERIAAKVADSVAPKVADSVAPRVAEALAKAGQLSVEKRAELLHDHYKDSFQQLFDHWKARNRVFMYVLIFLSLMAWETYDRGASTLLNSYVTKTFGPELKGPLQGQQSIEVPSTVIGSAAWALLLCLVIQYYQKSVLVDRQYAYLEHVEKLLKEVIGHPDITREGEAYKTMTGVPDGPPGRPAITNGIGLLYVFAFPVLLVVVVAFRLWREWSQINPETNPYNISFNTLIGVTVIIYTGLYLLWILYPLWIKFRKWRAAISMRRA